MTSHWLPRFYSMRKFAVSCRGWDWATCHEPLPALIVVSRVGGMYLLHPKFVISQFLKLHHAGNYTPEDIFFNVFWFPRSAVLHRTERRRRLGFFPYPLSSQTSLQKKQTALFEVKIFSVWTTGTLCGDWLDRCAFKVSLYVRVQHVRWHAIRMAFYLNVSVTLLLSFHV